jgi:hypothetical protein
VNYRRYIESSNITFKVNDHLIECGSTTWQIRNIAATSIRRKVIPFNEPEPVFTTPKPTLNCNFKAMLACASLTWLFAGSIINSLSVGFAAAIVVLIAFLVFYTKKLTANELIWDQEKQKVAENWKIWNEMRQNPPVIFSLELETNAGSKPLFYSFDESQILKANDAIKRSMEKKESGDITFQIETVNVGGDESINNFGSSIYNQSIQKGIE